MLISLAILQQILLQLKMRWNGRFSPNNDILVKKNFSGAMKSVNTLSYIFEYNQIGFILTSF